VDGKHDIHNAVKIVLSTPLIIITAAGEDVDPPELGMDTIN